MTQPSNPRPASFSPNAAVVRYQTPSIDRAVSFYTRHFGFHLRIRAGPNFALVSRGELNLILSGTGTSGARPMPDGRQQEPEHAFRHVPGKTLRLPLDEPVHDHAQHQQVPWVEPLNSADVPRHVRVLDDGHEE